MSDFLARISHFSAKRLALLADELNDRVQQLEAAHHEPVAIVGIGCRLPGGVESPEQFWALLRDGVDAVVEVPADRWNIDDYYDPDPDAPGRMNTRWGGFLGPVDGFDAGFFGISPREAQSMDPQQRLLLEVTWRALEDAGISPQCLEGSPTGVFLGLSGGDYYQRLRDAGGMASFDAYTASGTAHSIASGRLSYTLGLRGPSLSIDTACSSSLVAIHQAVHSLRRSECSLALAGGVNLILGPDITIALSRSHMMAPDGRCKAFDARADGFVRGEGCGMLVFKRLADAQRDGDRVLAVIRGAAANQDGRSNGLTAPNGPAQEAVLREALADAGLQAADVGYVEAHGTGTSLGDPIEVQALHAVLGAGRDPAAPLQVGSVKAAIGHLEAAAGVAGLIKAVLVLRHGQIPGQLHLQQPNPYIPWDRLAVTVPQRLTPWPAGAAPRRAGVSSFGFSGTNVHLVIEEAPPAVVPAPAVDRPLHLLTVSARSAPALQTMAAAMAARLAEPGARLADLATTANAGRAHFAERAGVVAATAAEAAAGLARVASGDADGAPGLHAGHAPTRAPRVAFLFTGQGAQYMGMARALYDAHPVFHANLERFDALLRPLLPRPLLSVLFPAAGETSPIDDTEYTQPALFAVEYALAQLWMSWGVKPHAVIGHSVGEYAAACIAGVFTLEEALALIAERGRLMGALPRGGAMASLAAETQRVREALRPYAGRLDIAALNGLAATVVSGEAAALDELLAQMECEGVAASRLKVSHAFHSPLVEPMLDAFAAAAAKVQWRAPAIDLYANLDGERAGAGIATPGYWLRHVRSAVQFAPAVQRLGEAGADVFIEIGPHPTLLGLARQCLADDGRHWLPSLRRGRDDWETLLDSLAQAYVAGVPVDWAGFDAPYPRQRETLPGYPFQRERYWVDAVAPPAPGTSPGGHALLGHEVLHPLGDERLFETRLHPTLQPWLADHRIQGKLLLPSPVCMEIAAAAAHEAFGPAAVEMADLTIQRALSVDTPEPVLLHSVLASAADGSAALRLMTRDADDGRWQVLATATLRRGSPAADTAADLESLRARTPQAVDVDGYYAWLGSLGLAFGPRFRGVASLQRGDGEVLAAVQLPAPLAGGERGLSFHPALLDACFHVVGAALPGGGSTLGDAFLLMNVERLRVFVPFGNGGWAHVRIHPDDRPDLAHCETFRAKLRLLDAQGAPVAEFSGVHFKRARAGAVLPSRLPARVRNMLHEIVWRELPAIGTAWPSPAALVTRLEAELPAVAERHGFDRYGCFLPGLDRLAAAYMLRALEALGADRRTPLDATSAARLGVLDRHRRLFARMLQVLAEDGWLQAQEVGCWLRQDDFPDPEALGSELAAAYPEALAELRLTQRCARELADVLRGRTDPLALLFPGGSLADTEKLYRDSPPAQAYNGLIAQIVAELAQATPAGRPLRLLEIGAGTGSTTAHVLPQLAGRSVEYTFTDVSPLFLHRARERFSGQAGMRFELLDVSRAPAEQGIAAAHYDVIVGANVVHATPDLQRSLDHVRSLLAPGGLLVLLEGTLPQRFGDVTVGLLEGWWAYTDTGRRHYALMARPQWLDLLAERGFKGARALPGDNNHPVWSQQAIFVAQAPRSAARARQHWLLRPDAGGVATALAAALRERGDTVGLLPAAGATPQALATAVAGALRTELPAAVVDLAALDTTLDDTTDDVSLMSAQQAMLGGALTLVQTLAAQGGPAVPPLWWATRGAQSVLPGETAQPAQATLWGLSHVVAIEHPELRCHRIDLDPAATPAQAAAGLLAELDQAGREDQLALRGSRRLARRLVPAPARREGAAAPRWREDRSVLVTGGLHGLGLRVARWLADQGVRHLRLMGRRAPDAAASAEIEAMRASGVSVQVLQGDVAQAADVRRAIFEAVPPVCGVVHSAGALDDGVIASLTWPRFETVMAAKVRGSWNLHRLSQGLDFMVFFSSGASVGGSAGQGNHAAANAFEDALAWHRQALGLPTLSINWGAWAEIGAAADRKLRQPGQLDLIAPADGLQALEYLLRRGADCRFTPAQVAVLATDWAHLRSPREAGSAPPLTAELALTAAIAPIAPAAPAAAGEPPLRERLGTTAANRRRGVLREEVRRLAARVLGLPRAEDLPVDEPLRQLGLDSLMAVELRNLLGKAVGQTLPATVTFDHPSVVALVDHLATGALADTLAPAGAPRTAEVAPPAAAPTTDTASALNTLDEDELARQLMNRLDQLGPQEAL